MRLALAFCLFTSVALADEAPVFEQLRQERDAISFEGPLYLTMAAVGTGAAAVGLNLAARRFPGETGITFTGDFKHDMSIALGCASAALLVPAITWLVVRLWRWTQLDALLPKDVQRGLGLNLGLLGSSPGVPSVPAICSSIWCI